jgi:hypothetical protein
MKESDLYQEQLRQAREHLERWESLGESLNKTGDLGWQCVLAQRQAALRQMELLIEMARD